MSSGRTAACPRCWPSQTGHCPGDGASLQDRGLEGTSLRKPTPRPSRRVESRPQGLLPTGASEGDPLRPPPGPPHSPATWGWPCKPRGLQAAPAGRTEPRVPCGSVTTAITTAITATAAATITIITKTAAATAITATATAAATTATNTTTAAVAVTWGPGWSGGQGTSAPTSELEHR